MVTPYMDHDLAGLLENPDVQFSEAQIKCYMLQLLEGLRYLHNVCSLGSKARRPTSLNCQFPESHSSPRYERYTLLQPMVRTNLTTN